MPETRKASAMQSRQSGLLSFPRTRPSSAPPASIITWAQAPCASVWMVELVKKTITGHMKMPMPKAKPGQR